METPSGARILIVEQGGRDVFRGREKSVTDAIEAGVAGLGVDRQLLKRAENHGVNIVMIVIEEQRRVFLAPFADFENQELYTSRTDYRGRALRVLPYTHFQSKYLGPVLQKRNRRAKTSAC